MIHKKIKTYEQFVATTMPNNTNGRIGFGMAYGREFVDAERQNAAQLMAMQRDIESEETEHVKKKEKRKRKKTPENTDFRKFIKTGNSVQEDSGGVMATGANTMGMGNAIPAGIDTIGSGDTFSGPTDDDDKHSNISIGVISYDEWMSRKRKKGKKHKNN